MLSPVPAGGETLKTRYRREDEEHVAVLTMTTELDIIPRLSVHCHDPEICGEGLIINGTR